MTIETGVLEASALRIGPVHGPGRRAEIVAARSESGSLGYAEWSAERSWWAGDSIRVCEYPDHALLMTVHRRWTDWVGRWVLDANDRPIARVSRWRMWLHDGRWTARIRRDPRGGRVIGPTPVAAWSRDGGATLLEFADEYAGEPWVKLVVLAVVLGA